MIYFIRKALYEFARDFIKPDPPVRAQVPDVGHVQFDEATTWGTYSGDVVMPPYTELTDATAFSLVMSAMWMINEAPARGLHGRLSHEGFRHRIKYSVEFEPLDESIKDEVMPMDPAGIRNLIHAMLASSETDYEYIEDEATDPGAAPIDLQAARERLRTNEE